MRWQVTILLAGVFFHGKLRPMKKTLRGMCPRVKKLFSNKSDQALSICTEKSLKVPRTASV